MSSLIADILQAQQPEFSQRIEKLEKLAGRPGSDIKLSLKLKNSWPKAIKKLGLDPGDTSGEEFYEALKRKLHKDNERIAEMIGVKDGDTSEAVIKKTTDYINKKIKMPDVWQLKGTFLRRIIRKHPPKILMKAVGYRSVDSILKREQLAEVIALGRTLDHKWYEKISEEYKRCEPTDIEQKKVKVIAVAQKRLGRINKTIQMSEGQVTGVNELGSIVIIPPQNRFAADVIASVVVLIEALREIKLTGSLLKFLTVRKDFGKIASTLIKNGSRSSEKILPVSWGAICHYAYRNNITPEFVQPHITQEDLDIVPTVTDFCIAFPELNFWYGFDNSALMSPKGPVSCNLVDTVLNTCNNLHFDNRTHDYSRRSLEDELYGTYLIFPGVQNELLRFKEQY